MASIVEPRLLWLPLCPLADPSQHWAPAAVNCRQHSGKKERRRGRERQLKTVWQSSRVITGIVGGGGRGGFGSILAAPTARLRGTRGQRFSLSVRADYQDYHPTTVYLIPTWINRGSTRLNTSLKKLIKWHLMANAHSVELLLLLLLFSLLLSLSLTFYCMYNHQCMITVIIKVLVPWWHWPLLASHSKSLHERDNAGVALHLASTYNESANTASVRQLLYMADDSIIKCGIRMVEYGVASEMIEM